MPLRQGGCEEWGSGWRRRFCKGGFRQDFDCRHTVVVHISDCNTPILHVHMIAQARLAALFVCSATVPFRGQLDSFLQSTEVDQWRCIPLLCPLFNGPVETT